MGGETLSTSDLATIPLPGPMARSQLSWSQNANTYAECRTSIGARKSVGESDGDRFVVVRGTIARR